MEFVERAPRRRRGIYWDLLERVRVEQSNHPGLWVEVRRYARKGGGYEAAWAMRKTNPGFEFRGQVDTNTGESVLYTRWGGDDNE